MNSRYIYQHLHRLQCTHYGPMVRRRAKTNWKHIFFREQFKFSFCGDGTPGGGAATLALNYRTEVTAADTFLVILVQPTAHPQNFIKKWFSICCIYCGMEWSLAGECWCWPSPHFIFTACDSSGQPVGGAPGNGGAHIQEDNQSSGSLELGTKVREDFTITEP